MIQRQTNLSANIVAFCRYLRSQNFTIGPSEEKDALMAMDTLEAVENPELLELCLQSTLCRSPQQLKAFPGLYRGSVEGRQFERYYNRCPKPILLEKI